MRYGYQGIKSLRTLEKKFGKPHPELEGVPEIPSNLRWVQHEFFRLHRRRRFSEGGVEPLSLFEITHYAQHVLELSGNGLRFFLRAIEATDDEVLVILNEQSRKNMNKQLRQQKSK